MGRIILGCDPGLGGALALYAEDAPEKISAEDMPVLAGQVNAVLLADIIRTYKPDLAIVERVGARPKQGVTSCFNFGRSFGVILGTLAALNVRTELVAPTQWKRFFRLPSDKEASRAYALAHWPARAELFRRKKDEGRAEAALLALYGSDNF
jgi:crossover junction endodeoxyribonuclease RuvC